MKGLRRLIAWTLALTFLALPCVRARAGSDEVRRGYGAGSAALELQGSPVGFLRSASGGDLEGDVVATPAASGFNKHIASVHYTDLVLEVGAGMEPAVYDWIAAAWESKATRTSGAVAIADYSFNVIARKEFSEALITETSLPALDAASKDPAFLTVRIAPETVRRNKGGGTVPSTQAAKQRPWLANSFRLEIPGLDCTRVRRIEPIRIGTKITHDDAGETRTTPVNEPTTTKVSDLVVTLPEANADTWLDWMQQFLAQGRNDDSQEKNGDLVLLGTDMQSEIARIHLYGLGISSLKQTKADNVDAIRSVVCTLYCEHAALEWKGGGGAVLNVRVFGR
ncbi:MAG TPA: phage tail protein [Candidatus Binatia bacterium]|nr:phage tail protein [Candidatus Binatia bacterium]